MDIQITSPVLGQGLHAGVEPPQVGLQTLHLVLFLLKPLKQTTAKV